MRMGEISMQWPVEAVFRDGASCRLLDQRALPAAERYLNCETSDAVIDAIRTLAVRGAPAIGVAGAYAACLAARESLAVREPERLADWYARAARISAARPTAVNLSRAVDALRRTVAAAKAFDAELVGLLDADARALAEWEREASRRMAVLGAERLPEGSVLTHCNTGCLATVGEGTALAAVVEAYRRGKVARVIAGETRPLLQGLRLTAWELGRAGVPFSVVCDGAAGSLMRAGEIAAVVVGADRIAANGDVANKIGTYGLAVLARHHGLPFFVVAPTTTVDPACPSGDAIPIEERASEEIWGILGPLRSPPSVRNPAFDVTPAELVTAWISERVALERPSRDGVAGVMSGIRQTMNLP